MIIEPQTWGNQLVEFFLLVDVNDAIRFRVWNAGQKIPLTHLALTLANFPSCHLACAGGARSGAARKWQLHPCVFSRLKNVGVVGGLKLVLFSGWACELHLFLWYYFEFDVLANSIKSLEQAIYFNTTCCKSYFHGSWLCEIIGPYQLWFYEIFALEGTTI
jgi:hypothetical protein